MDNNHAIVLERDYVLYVTTIKIVSDIIKQPTTECILSICENSKSKQQSKGSRSVNARK